MFFGILNVCNWKKKCCRATQTPTKCEVFWPTRLCNKQLWQSQIFLMVPEQKTRAVISCHISYASPIRLFFKGMKAITALCFSIRPLQTNRKTDRLLCLILSPPFLQLYYTTEVTETGPMDRNIPFCLSSGGWFVFQTIFMRSHYFHFPSCHLVLGFFRSVHTGIAPLLIRSQGPLKEMHFNNKGIYH